MIVLIVVAHHLAATSARCQETETPVDEEVASGASLFQRGRYTESQEKLDRFAATSVDAAVLAARCRLAVGNRSKAVELLESAQDRFGDSIEPTVRLAKSAFAVGDYPRAEALIKQAVAKDPKHALARWLAGELHRVAGRDDEAEKEYQLVVDEYARLPAEQIDAERLRWTARAAVQLAEWKGDTQSFNLIVNELLPAAERKTPGFWQARLESARLFLSKYNKRQAAADIDAALAINSNAAEIHALRAEMALQSFNLEAARQSIERALEINPNLLAARLLDADAHFVDLNPHAAVSVLEEARKLNPVDEHLLGRLAAAYHAVDGLHGECERAQKLATAAAERNPRCGHFFVAAADAIDRMRRFPFATAYYEQAIESSPRMVGVRGKLGMLLMRLGDEPQAKQVLDESFRLDPFNVRVKNTLEVLDVLQGYAVLETEHFVLKFDRGRDGVLAQHAARYLEEQVYGEVVAAMGFEPPEKTLIEIFSRARNSSGHSWFSARMVGLPSIGTVGACAGRMVALTSPNDGRPFNWANVLKHEFVHVVNLQQTHFNIPHWYTEALAVRQERRRRPREWELLLSARAGDDKLFNLQNINMGFIRPGNRSNWTLAYCQAEVYAEYLVSRFGDDALRKLLAAYADNQSTSAALKSQFNVDESDFEQGYRDYVKELVDSWPSPADVAQVRFAELIRSARDNPENADLQARLAAAYLDRGQKPAARAAAMNARKISPRHSLAAFVLASLQISIGDKARAREILADCIDVDAPEPRSLKLAALLAVEQRSWDRAAELYGAGLQHFADRSWREGLVRVYLRSGDRDKLKTQLAELSGDDPDNSVYRKSLAQLALAAKDFENAVKWANQALHINVMDAAVHASLGSAYASLEKPKRAVAAFETAVQLAPREPRWRLELAKAQIADERPAIARRTLDELLEIDPANEAAKELLKSLPP